MTANPKLKGATGFTERLFNISKVGRLFGKNTKEVRDRYRRDYRDGQACMKLTSSTSWTTLNSIIKELFDQTLKDEKRANLSERELFEFRVRRATLTDLLETVQLKINIGLKAQSYLEDNEIDKEGE